MNAIEKEEFERFLSNITFENLLNSYIKAMEEYPWYEVLAALKITKSFKSKEEYAIRCMKKYIHAYCKEYNEDRKLVRDRLRKLANFE